MTIAQAQKYLLEHNELAFWKQEQEEKQGEKQEKGKEKEKEKEEKKEEKEKKDTAKENAAQTTAQAILCTLSNTQYPKRDKIIFNEIAWMGTTNSASDEWIELKNISGEQIDLTGWQILDKAALEGKSNAIKIVSTSGKSISAGGFFLLERTGDNTVPGIPADLIYTGSLSNTKDALYLFDENCALQDFVKADSNWPAGDNSSKRTMERKNDLTWQTSSNIEGTPKAENSIGEIILAGGSSTASSQSSQSSQFHKSSQPALCSLPATPSPVYSPIIFNEIAWMGTASSTYDEWIELKNTSTSTISLDNWQIIGRKISSNTTPSIKIFLPNKSIGCTTSTAYFLLEKNNNNPNPVLENLRDMVYTGGSLINNPNPNFELYLFDNNCQLIDFIQATSSWLAGDNSSKRTMERDQNLSWHTYCGDGENGIMGTPKKENSQPPLPQPILEISTTTLSFEAQEDRENPATTTLTIQNSGKAEMAWTALIIYSTTTPTPTPTPTAWLSFQPATGTLAASTSSTIQVSVNISGLTVGNYQATATIEAFDSQGRLTQNSPQKIPVKLVITPKPKIAGSVVISEVQVNGKPVNTKPVEFLEIYNPKNQATSTIGWHLCYFTQEKNWNSSTTKCWEFPTSTTSSIIEANKYYLIGVSNYPTSTQSGYPETDWTLLTNTGKSYIGGQLKNDIGAIGIFSCNPKNASTTDLAKSCKIDLFSWKKDGSTSTEVYEGNSFSFQTSDIEEKSFQRKKFEGKFIDNNNNSTDFEINYPTPTNSKGETGNILPPGSVTNFKIAIGQTYDNLVALTWSTTTDIDTPTSNISYIIYWSKNSEITTSTLDASTTASTTTTSTSITIDNLYYDSTYYFGIRAFDGLHYSALTILPNPLKVEPEIPIWEPYISRGTSFPGTNTSTTKWTYSLSRYNPDDGFISSGPAIDQNGTIYFSTTKGIMALNSNGSLKWKYFILTSKPSTPPLISSDGTIYVGLGDGRIIALSPAGRLKSVVAEKIFSRGGITLDFQNSILYYTASYNDYKAKKATTSLGAINLKDRDKDWHYDFPESNSSTSCIVSPISRPIISSDGKIYFGYSSSSTIATTSSYFIKLVSFDIKKQDKVWEKKIPFLKSCWEGSNFSNLRSIVLSDKNMLYIIVHGTWEGFWCGIELYALNLNNVIPTTTSITTTEAWKKVVGVACPQESPILLGKNQDYIYLRTRNNRTNSKSILYRVSSTGTFTKIPTPSVPYEFTPYLLDEKENIYGTNVAAWYEIVSLNANGEERWRKEFHVTPSSYFYPVAFSKDGTLYGTGWNSEGYRLFYAIGP